jgi:multisubunit Na+/H+ antiporter MnhB subunit
LYKAFILPVIFNVTAVAFGLFLAATPYLAKFYENHPEFKTAALILGPIVVLVALTNMIFATLHSVKHLGSRNAHDA